MMLPRMLWAGAAVLVLLAAGEVRADGLDRFKKLLNADSEKILIFKSAKALGDNGFVLEGVVTQNLIAKASGPGRVLAIEVMVPNAAIRNLIREDKVHQIYSQMQVGQSKFGMQTFNQSLASLIQRGMISLEEGIGRSSDAEELRNVLASGVKPGVNRPVQAR